MLKSKKPFNAQKLVMILKLASNRLVIHRNKDVELSNVHKKEIAELLEQGKDDQARVRTISLITEDYQTEVLNMLLLYCETVMSRAKVMESQKSCPLDVKEAVCGIIYSAPYLEKQVELLKARKMLLDKYGKKFPEECVECNCVNPKITHRLSNNSPEDNLVNYYLNTIAKKHNVNWESNLPDTQSRDAPELLLPSVPDLIPTLPELPSPPKQLEHPTDASKCQVYGSGLKTGIVGEHCSFIIQAADSLGNLKTTGGDTFNVLIQGQYGDQIYGTVTDNHNGSYTASYIPPRDGGFAIAIYLDRTPVPGGPWVANISSSIFTDASKCEAFGPG
eukprot:TRINITY_DN6502_c0_g3_i1.p1 TRINITY_DN6502_c0_g3~~TRINITY_DN6502_c0_g3_i1.p1  ORF type:complete len:333 (+),score=51.19 TRINITY_DN6502_c0_g3_i1:192-1190(+)